MSPENHLFAYFIGAVCLVMGIYLIHSKLEKKRIESLEKAKRKTDAAS